MTKNTAFIVAIGTVLLMCSPTVYAVRASRGHYSPAVSHVDGPVLLSPGDQVSPVTDRYGYAGTVLAAGPTGYWRFEDRVPSAVADWATTLHPGVKVGGVTSGGAGALSDGSRSMQFDGAVGSHIDVGDVAAFDFSRSVTVEAWVDVTDQNATGAVFDRRDSGGGYVLMQEVGNWIFRVGGNVEFAQAVAPVVAEDVNHWVHMVGTYDGATACLYRNGVLVASRTNDSTFSLGNGSGTVRIGELGAGGYAFQGRLDEVAVYGSALTAGQVKNHYALHTASPSVTLPLSASDADNDVLTYSATGLPTGLLIDPATGVISGDPLAAGTYPVTISASDPGGLSSNQSFTWTISATPVASPHQPVLTNPGNQNSAPPATSGYARTVLALNPAAYWRLENDGASTITDWAAVPHAANVSGGIARGVSGALADGGHAIQLDGQLGTHLDVDDASMLGGSIAVTVEAWVYPFDQNATGP